MRRQLLLLPLLALCGCGLTYKPAVDLAANGTTPARYDADVETCRSQAFSAGYRYNDEHPLIMFGLIGGVANAALGRDDPDDPGANIMAQPGGTMRYIDWCMRGKGYRVEGRS